MRGFSILVAFICLPFLMNAQTGYKKALGIRLNTHTTYDVIAASYKIFPIEKGALEFNLGFGGRNIYVPNQAPKTSFSPAVSLSGSYQYHEIIETPTNEELRWFAGGGLTFMAAKSKNNGYEGFGTAIFGACGIDYVFKNSPINVTADWRPQVYIASPSAYMPLHLGTLGLAVRYIF